MDYGSCGSLAALRRIGDRSITVETKVAALEAMLAVKPWWGSSARVHTMVEAYKAEARAIRFCYDVLCEEMKNADAPQH
jgi:hypothetical protein